MNIVISPYLDKKNPEFAQQYPNVIEGLRLSSLSRGANLEKLHAQALYSIRLSRKSRLILTRAGDGDWLLLDELPNHEYHKARFSKKHLLEFSIAVSDEVEPSVEEASLEPVELTFFNHQFIQLSPEQNQTLSTKLPLVVQGMPGSGKSCVALSMIRQCIDVEGHRILYVTSSSRLVENMQSIWHKTPGVGEAVVEFKSYADLVPGVSHADRRDFEAWWQHNPKLRNELTHGLSRSVDIASLVYQEFRMMSAYSIDEYQTFSDRQRLVDKARYPLLYRALASYRSYLEEVGKTDISLVPLTHEATYTHVFVDEAQDFSTLQLFALRGLAKQANIAYFIDSNQSLNDNFSKLPSLKRLLAKDYHTLELPYTFRCARAVIDLANDTLRLKHFVVGGVLDKASATAINPAVDAPAGAVLWLDEMKDIVHLTQSVKTAIICDTLDRDEVRRLYPGAVILTVTEAKGLEYEHIIVYHLLERYMDKRLNEVASGYVSTADKVNRPKAGQAHHEYGPSLNLLFTAFTRARSNVYVLHQKNTHGISHVLKALKRDKVEPVATPSVAPSSKDDVLAEVRRQILAGNREVAWSLYQHHIDDNRQDFQAVCDRIFPPMEREPQKAMVVKKVSRKPISVPEEKKSMKLDKALSLLAKNKGRSQSVEDVITTFLFELEQLLVASDPAHDYLLKPVVICGESHTMADFIQRKVNLKGPLSVFLNNKGFSGWATSIQGKKLLFMLFHAHPDLAKAIQPATLFGYKINSGQNSERKISRLSLVELFSLTEQGCGILKQLFTQNESLIHQFDPYVLYRKMPEGMTLFNNSSTLFWLSSTAIGHEILRLLFTLNRSLLRHMSLEALCRPVSIPEHGKNISALYMLSGGSENIKVLELIDRFHPKLFQEIKAEDLGQFIDSVDNEKVNTSTLYHLSNCSAGWLFLLKLFDKNPRLLLGIQPEHIYPVRNNLAEDEENVSVFFNFVARSQQGCQILITLFKHNPRFMQKLTGKILCLMRTKAAVELENLSILFMLSTSDAGLELLDYIFDKNPSIINEITIDALCRFRPEAAIKHANTSALYYFAMAERERHFLIKIFKQNKKLSQKMTSDALCRTLSNHSKEMQNMSPLYCLAATSFGCEVLLELFSQNPELLKGIPLNSFSLTRAQEFFSLDDGKECEGIFSVLYFFSGDRNGVKLMNLLLTHNPGLMAEIPAEAFLKYMPPAAGEYHNTSVFYFLAKNEESFQNLRSLLQLNPKLIQAMTIDDLTRDCHRAVNEQILYPTILQSLESCVAGRVIIAEILKYHPGWIQQLPFKNRAGLIQEHPALVEESRMNSMRFFGPGDADEIKTSTAFEQVYPQKL